MYKTEIPAPIRVETRWITAEGVPQRDIRLLTDLLPLLAHIYEERGELKAVCAVMGD